MNRYILCCLPFVFGGAGAFGQTVVHGFVADSASLRGLPNVNIRFIGQPYGTISDRHGHFSLKAVHADTLIFSIVGYHSKHVVVTDLVEYVVAYLKEQPTLLREIMISPNISIFGIPKIEPESPYINPTYTKAYTDTPGVPNMQTFGPSYIYKGVFSRYSKYEKERKKLPRVRAQNEKAKNYITVINNPDLREELKLLYALTEGEFYDTLTLFNERYQASVYDLEAKELTALLHMFYAEIHGKD